MYSIASLLDDPVHNLKTVRDLFRWTITEMEKSDLSYGHGSPSPYEEASFLICRGLKLPFEHFDQFLDAHLTHEELRHLVNLVDLRVHAKLPVAYILKEAWLTGHKFYIDERALIPRSYIAELLEEDLAPWVEDPESVGSVLDLCTGSGCLAILAQGAFPNAEVTGSDLSAEALDVEPQINRHEYGMDETLELVQGDLFENLQGRTFDIILSNPPYVTQASMDTLPDEYRHEPALALGAGEDGMNVIARMLPEAASHLNPGGFIVVELGDNANFCEALFPGLPFMWLETSGGGDQVFLLMKEDLDAYFGATDLD